MKLSKWLKSHLKDSIKGTLKETINHLLQLEPPLRGNTEQAKALKTSLRNLLKNDEELCKKYELLNTWLSEDGEKKNLKIINKNHQASFKKVRILQYNVSHGANSTQSQNFNNAAKEEPEEPTVSTINNNSDDLNDYEKINEPLALQVPKRYSLSASKQGSFTKPIFEHVERFLFRFISKHRQYIPSNTVKEFVKKCVPPQKSDFSNADLLCLLNFIIQNVHLFTNRSNQSLFNGDYKFNPLVLFKSFKEVRNFNAYGITQQEERWDDDKLQRLLTLALEVVVCFNDEMAFEPLTEIKKKLDFELAEHLISTTKRKNEDDEDDGELGKLSDFALDIIDKLDSSDELKQIVRLALEKNDTFMNVRKSLATQRDESTKIRSS